MISKFDYVDNCNAEKIIRKPIFKIDFDVPSGLDFLPAPIICDKMVLQRNAVTRLFGKAFFDGNFAVQIGNVVNYGAAHNGEFEIFLEPLLANRYSQNLVFYNEKSKLLIKDVLIGEVFLMSGQSNMAWTMNQTMSDQGLHGGTIYPYTGGKYIPDKGEPFYDDWLGDSSYRQQMIKSYTEPFIKSENKLLRIFKIDTEDTGLEPQTEFVAADKPREYNDKKIRYLQWAESDKEINGYVSAIAFYFGTEMTKLVNIPIALVVVALCGSLVCTWTPEKEYLQNKDWFNYGGENALKEPDNAQNLASRCYNMYIAPIIKYKFKAVVWYQGETQDINWAKSMSVLISSWRKNMESPCLPFLVFQVARVGMFDVIDNNYNSLDVDAPTQSLIYFNCREEQRKLCRMIENCEYVVNVDNGDYDEIHYYSKREIGFRAAKKFAKSFYDMQNFDDSPEVESFVKNSDGSVDIFFNNCENGLKLINNGRNFEVSYDKNSYETAANIQLKNANCLSILCKENCDIKIIRYGALNYPKISRHEMNLYLSLFTLSDYPANQFIIYL